VTSEKLEFDKPGALTRYFAKRWLEKPSAQGEQLIAWLLEAALGKNALYFIEKTKEYVDAWKGSGEVVPVDAFDGFVITGDPVEDSLIPHAVLVWTCMNDRPWREEVYHRWLDRLLAAGSAEAAYLAASLWPAHDLMAKVTYRPPGWLIYRGQLDAEAERVILTEMLKGDDGPRASLYGSFEYDDVPNPKELPKQYIKRHGFTHPICGLVGLRAFEWYVGLENRIQEALAAPSWSEGVQGAAMLLYLSLKPFNNLMGPAQKTLNILEQNLYKLDERHINIINFHMNKIEKIDYNLIKDYINYLIILCSNPFNKNSYLNKDKINPLIKIISRYISIGLKTKDIFYIGREFKDIIFNLIIEEKDKAESWLKKQADDLRLRDVLIAAYMSKIFKFNDSYFITINEELKTGEIEKKINDIYGKIKYFSKIMLFINQARIYFNLYRDLCKICCLIDDILKREARINFSGAFRLDYEKIILHWYPNRSYLLSEHMLLKSKHIGLYLYYGILSKWRLINFRGYIKEEKELKLCSETKDKIMRNLYIETIDSVCTNINLYLNKIESNNLPYKEVIIDLINIIENNYDKMQEYFKDESKMIKIREVILSNIYLLRDKLRNSNLIGLLEIDNKSQNIIIY